MDYSGGGGGGGDGITIALNASFITCSSRAFFPGCLCVVQVRAACLPVCLPPHVTHPSSLLHGFWEILEHLPLQGQGKWLRHDVMRSVLGVLGGGEEGQLGMLNRHRWGRWVMSEKKTYSPCLPLRDPSQTCQDVRCGLLGNVLSLSSITS